MFVTQLQECLCQDRGQRLFCKIRRGEKGNPLLALPRERQTGIKSGGERQLVRNRKSMKKTAANAVCAKKGRPKVYSSILEAVIDFLKHSIVPHTFSSNKRSSIRIMIWFSPPMNNNCRDYVVEIFLQLACLGDTS